jgi:hypothetical protein
VQAVGVSNTVQFRHVFAATAGMCHQFLTTLTLRIQFYICGCRFLRSHRQIQRTKTTRKKREELNPKRRFCERRFILLSRIRIH